MVNPTLTEKIAVTEHLAELESSGVYDAGIEAVTRALKEHCGVLPEADSFSPVRIGDLVKIASQLDVELFTVGQEQLPSGVRGILIETSANDENRKVILIPKGMKTTTAKLEIALEFGRLVLDISPLPGEIVHESLTSYREHLTNEFRADYFAGSLLLDETSFRTDIEVSEHDIGKLARKYEVSYEAAAHRMVALSHEVSHFVKADSSGEILKRMANARSDIDWDYVYRLCHTWGTAQSTQYLDKVVDDVNRMIWFPRAEQTEADGIHAIALGVDSEADSKFRLLNEQRFQSRPS